ncbi:MAG: carbohydrate ABC transporter permease [Anaerolineaceae bacterium]|jgi:multiple sugar transport system permease protein
MTASLKSDLLASKQRRARKLARQILHEVLAHIVLITAGISFALPFLWMISTSLKGQLQVMVWPPQWIPNPVLWSNYLKAVTLVPFFLYLKNTVVIALWNVVGIMISCPLVAYGLSRIRWPGRDFLFILVLCTMMLPYEVTMIPLFMIFNKLGWIGSYKPLIVPAFFGGPFFIFLLRQFFMSIPAELSDAATIDGCSDLQIMWFIILPLSKPALATVALFTFIANWQDFLAPLIYIRDESRYTLSLGLQSFLGLHNADWALLMAASTLMILPIVIIFFLTQRTFIQGITFSGLKE